jgi:hypothetical protein
VSPSQAVAKRVRNSNFNIEQHELIGAERYKEEVTREVPK